jgi:hypothetical protein
MPSDARGRCRGIRLCVLRERAAGRRSTLRFRAKEGARCGRRSADHSKRFKWRAFHRQPLAGLGTSGQRKSFPGVSGSGGGGSSVGGASGAYQLRIASAAEGQSFQRRCRRVSPCNFPHDGRRVRVAFRLPGANLPLLRMRKF